MSTNDIWYGILDAGNKSTPVVRDLSMQVNNNKIWLYNYARNTFVEYSLTIVEPMLRELTTSDISRNELDRAFKAARQAFTRTRKIHKWDDKTPAARHDSKNDDIETESVEETEAEEFIDDVDEDN